MPVAPVTPATPVTPVTIAAAPFKAACSSCSLRELCLPVGLAAAELAQLDQLVAQRRSVPRGQSLFRAGERFQALYAVRTGFFKTHVGADDGHEQVTGFQMAGDLLGLDGIASERHNVDAIALEDSQVCAIPYAELESVAQAFPGLQRQLQRIMSREIVRDHGVMLLLGSMRAEERLAAFLLNLAQRLRARGFSASELVLRMTREEIGSYLGLKLETVSRAFSKLQQDGVLDVQQRHIRILDAVALRNMVSSAAG